MRLPHRPRLPCQFLSTNRSSVPTGASLLRSCPSQSSRGTACRRLYATGAASGKPSRFSAAVDAQDERSPFRRHRDAEFAKDAESEDPVFPELYPRIQPSADRLPVAEFLESFHNRLNEDNVMPVTLTGRIRSKRTVGSKLIFLDIVNDFRKVQVMLNRNKCFPEGANNKGKFSLFRQMIQVGDFVSVEGKPVLAGHEERTLEAMALPELLSPALEPIPEVLTDPKTRMQNRHVDLLVNKESMDVLRLRSEILRHIREFLQSKKFLEVQTPIMAENAGGAVARPFVTRATEMSNKDLSLRVAPELWLKRLVVGGMDRVFEIGPSFRNESVDPTHNPEFTSCEFYSAYSSLEDLIRLTSEMITSLATHSSKLITEDLTTLAPIDSSRFVGPFKQVEFVPALEEAMGLRLPRLSTEDALPELLAVLKLAGVHVPGEPPSTLAKLLDRLAAMYIEPMSTHEPIFIINQPACMSPLAKSFICPKTYQLVSARAELFVGGRELANMYEEENSPEEQKRKLEAHRSLVNLANGRIGIETPENNGLDSDGEASPLDQSFIKALEFGLPPTGGWGCGVERLVMLFSGANRIGDCLSFGTLRNVVSVSVEGNKKSDRSS